jgi:hypothetical protein
MSKMGRYKLMKKWPKNDQKWSVINRPKSGQKLGSQNVQIIDFCYIVVSTIFGPSGPPPGPPKCGLLVARGGGQARAGWGEGGVG